MSSIHLCKDLSALQLAPADEENYGRSVLHSTVYLGPYAFHAWAIQVEKDEEDPPRVKTYIGEGEAPIEWTDARERIRIVVPRVESQQTNRMEPAATNAVRGLLHLPLSRDEWWEAMNLLGQDIWPNPISSERTTLESVVSQASPEHAMELRTLLRNLVDAIQYRDSVHGSEQEANGKTVYSEALSEAKKYLAAT